MRRKFVIASMLHETNTFSPLPTPITSTLLPCPAARSACPKAAVVLPLPSPVWTMTSPCLRRRKSALTLVLADIDHFKRINDTYGHQVGDLVLRRVARRLQDQLRRIDTVCRVGGEEFALILPDTPEAAGQEVVARLLAENPLEEFQHLGQNLCFPVTFSFGTVTFPEVAGDAFELFNKADEMLYFSKDAGRNQCYSWKPDGQHVQLLPSADPL